jgi:hypothetical protein
MTQDQLEIGLPRTLRVVIGAERGPGRSTAIFSI